MHSVSKIAALLVCTPLVSGCVTGMSIPTPAAGPALAPAPLPSYVVGEAFEFDDGRLDTVAALDGEKVTWRNKYGIDVLRYRNIVVPDLAWKTSSRVSTLDTDVIPADLWPLKVGNSGRPFKAVQTVVWPDGSQPDLTFDYAWQCRVTGTATVTVPAGRFDTYVVPCTRTYREGSVVRQVRTFYYAPALNHFVKRTDDYLTARSRSIELVNAGFSSFVLPRGEEADLTRTLFKALDTNADGKATTWRRPDNTMSVVLTPTSTFRSVQGETCRIYTSTYQYKKRTRTNARTLCHRTDGTWYRVLN